MRTRLNCDAILQRASAWLPVKWEQRTDSSHSRLPEKRQHLQSDSLLVNRCKTFLLLAFIFAATTNASLESRANEPTTNSVDKASSSLDVRLPKFVVPERYDMTFSPDLQTFQFTGAGDITLSISKPTNSIVLNSLDLKISPASITALAGGETQEANIKTDPENERVILTFPSTLQPGKYRLKLVFTGELNDKLRGFYRSYYMDAKGNKQWIATTQMEPTDARRMFPCFDEPDMKAVFKFTAIIQKNLNAISNGAIEKEEIDDSTGLKVVTFKESPIMSSYLVALIVGKFKPTETRIACGVPVKVWALDGKDKLGMFALDAACKILEYQTKYFDIRYPTDKLDLIAIPDFRSGAMENLGAVTFRENNLLVDEKTGSNFLKRRVFAIIAHELAHQWFGDLVTMKWWDDLWLNEAFASWMGTKTTDALRPEWQELTRAIFTRNSSMNIDELKATRAIHAEVRDPKQAAEMFDSITYDKGESILWMLEGFVGVQKMQTGIHDYLVAHRFGNATGDNLWQAIGKASDQPVPELMQTWISQPGFPLVTIGSADSSGSTTLSQNRFFGTPGIDPGDQLWNIPVVARELKPEKSSEKRIDKIVSKNSETIPVPGEWGNNLLVNVGGRGYYRTKYQPENQKKIIEQFDSLSVEERICFLSDLNALVWQGSLPVEDKLSTLLKATGESDSLVQNELVERCNHPYHYLRESEKKSYQKLIKAIVGPVKSKVGWIAKEGEPDSTKDLRNSTLHLMGTLAQDGETIKEARAHYKKYMENRESIPSDIASTVLGIVAFNGSATEYDAILAAKKKETIPELEKRFLFALTGFAEPALVDRTLQMSLSDEIRIQDGFSVLSSLLGHHRTKHRAWEFVKLHWDEIAKRFPPRSLQAIAYACNSFDRPSEEADLKQFFNSRDLPYARTSIARMLEDVHRGVLYRERNEKKIESWVVNSAKKVGTKSGAGAVLPP